MHIHHIRSIFIMVINFLLGLMISKIHVKVPSFFDEGPGFTRNDAWDVSLSHILLINRIPQPQSNHTLNLKSEWHNVRMMHMDSYVVAILTAIKWWMLLSYSLLIIFDNMHATVKNFQTRYTNHHYDNSSSTERDGSGTWDVIILIIGTCNGCYDTQCGGQLFSKLLYVRNTFY